MNSNDLRSGMTILMNNVVHEVVESQHHKPGKGPAFVRTKLKNLNTGSIFDHTFRAKESLTQAIVEKKQMQYLYRDKNLFYFMDPDSYEQMPIPEEKVKGYLKFLKENDSISFKIYEGEVLQTAMPDFVNLVITESLPGAKGDTAQGATKPAVLETGLEVQVPLFIKEGETIKVDTRNGKYVERVNKK
ncbi:elongation factor P [Candidatus Uabimicrobium sp. HlEnr_7]|uniref:elongation factor P n=1 Tax=Candidatus Uabimicrobium helgolandensis TaxID=3095367 RepID=UPI0035585F1F